MTKDSGIPKAATGIAGLDAITGGGLPRGRTTMIEGAPGAGKTVFALQALVHGARKCEEPAVFVAFEESAKRIIINSNEFGWDLNGLQENDLFFINAQPSVDLVQSGTFDLDGMLATLDAKMKAMGARRIAFDAIDVILSLLDDPKAVRREMYRLHDWLLSRELTAIITHKAVDQDFSALPLRFNFLQFMVDCAITLTHEVVGGVSQRSLRVIKYRGSAFDENDAPVVIGSRGIEVAHAAVHSTEKSLGTTERISSGIERLDTMLGGGYFRGAGILFTGAPGTAKTTLAGAFAEAACKRGEATLFVSFDSTGEEVVRNLASVGIHLAPHVEKGLLQIIPTRSFQGSAEVHFMRIREEAEAHACRCLIIDPVSALTKSGKSEWTHSVVERLVDWTKRQGVTLVVSSLLDNNHPELEGTPIEVSTIADTWIHLSYLVLAGERNRALSIVKSRGTQHSNQVREMVMSADGVTLSDVYTAGGEVLMGALRAEKERAEDRSRKEAEALLERRRRELDADTAELEARLLSMQRALAHKQAERTELDEREAGTAEEVLESQDILRERRGGDADSTGIATKSDG
jgi:circadian clock protein KaiC